MGAHVLGDQGHGGIVQAVCGEALVKALQEEIEHPDSLPHARHERDSRRRAFFGPPTRASTSSMRRSRR